MSLTQSSTDHPYMQPAAMERLSPRELRMLAVPMLIRVVALYHHVLERPGANADGRPAAGVLPSELLGILASYRFEQEMAKKILGELGIYDV